MALLSSDRSFSTEQQLRLKILADMMIPASDDMPSAADTAILDETLIALTEHRDLVMDALAGLEELAQNEKQKSVVDLGDGDRQALVARFKEDNPVFIQILQSSVLASYYRDDRVLRTLGLPDRAPFPEGNAVDETDWSLLDQVRQRAPFYRDADQR